MMGAGFSTQPGGYSQCCDNILEQFAAVYNRSPTKMAEAIRQAWYDPIWKDFDQAFYETAWPAANSLVQGGSVCI
jgi:hypothetical protein